MSFTMRTSAVVSADFAPLNIRKYEFGLLIFVCQCMLDMLAFLSLLYIDFNVFLGH